jgi:hypothetical protein
MKKPRARVEAKINKILALMTELMQMDIQLKANEAERIYNVLEVKSKRMSIALAHPTKSFFTLENET